MKIQQSTEYNQFSTILGNRVINMQKVNKLTEDIEAGLNLLPYCPIVVYKKDDHYHIIDGQHRFEASKKIESPVFFVECKELELKQIARMNSRSDKWKTVDFLECYIKIGMKDYETLKAFVKKYKVGYSCAIYFLMDGNPNGSMKSNQKFRDGEFAVNHLELASEIAELTESIFNRYTFSKNRYLMGAVQKIKNAGICDFEKLKSKISENPKGMDPQPSVKEYIYNIERVYNFKNSKRVTIF